jgi:hypothetical protein
MRSASETIRFDIFIAGDLAVARQVCRSYCQIGLCITIEPVDFVYTGGMESGVRVGLINYPRFPTSKDDLRSRAIALAERLRDMLYQHSYSIVGPDETIWDTRRE